jgi:hypothetical protein
MAYAVLGRSTVVAMNPMRSPLKQLREEREGGDAAGGGAGEEVGVDEGQVESDLEGVLGAGHALEVFEIGVEVAFAGGFHFDEEPGLPGARDQEIHLPFGFVPQVEQVVFPETKVGPTVDGLEQVRGDQVLTAGAFIRHQTPVPQKDLRLFAQGFRNIAEPRAHAVAVEQTLQRGDPAAHGIYRDVGVRRQGRVVGELTHLPGEQFGEHLNLTDIVGMRQIAQVFAE